jgi:L-iditol 2-dehydrogenase
MKDLDIEPDSKVVILGSGPIGTAFAAIAVGQGVSLVMLADTLERRLKIAESVLGDKVRYLEVANSDPVVYVRAAVGGDGADRVIVACAAPELHEQAVRMAGRRGRVLFFSDLPPGISHVALPTNFQYEREITIMGSYASRRKDQLCAMSMLRHDSANLRAIVSDVLPLDDIEKAFHTLREGAALKLVIQP